MKWFIPWYPYAQLTTIAAKFERLSERRERFHQDLESSKTMFGMLPLEFIKGESLTWHVYVCPKSSLLLCVEDQRLGLCP